VQILKKMAVGYCVQPAKIIYHDHSRQLMNKTGSSFQPTLSTNKIRTKRGPFCTSHSHHPPSNTKWLMMNWRPETSGAVRPRVEEMDRDREIVIKKQKGKREWLTNRKRFQAD